MPTLATLFCAILTDLRAALGAFMARQSQPPQVVWLGSRAFLPVQTHPATRPIPVEILALACTRLGQAMQRFAWLYERWRSNTLPKLRPSRARPSCSPPALGLGEPEGGRLPTNPAKPRLPRRHAWLAGATDHRVRGHASQLNHLLSQSDANDFLAAVPRAGRILRPLCHMLGISPPSVPKRLPSPRKTRPRPEKPPREPQRHGKYTDAQIRRYSPGRIPDPRPKPA